MPVQRCTVHKHRNPLARCAEEVHGELSADYTDMIYAKTVKDAEAKHKAFYARQRRLKCSAVVGSLEELNTALHLPALPARAVEARR